MTYTEELVLELRQRAQDHRASRLGYLYSNSDAEIDEQAADTIELLTTPRTDKDLVTVPRGFLSCIEGVLEEVKKCWLPTESNFDDDVEICLANCRAHLATAQPGKPVKDTSSAMSDALVHGTGISLDGKHIPLDEFYARPAPADDEQVMRGIWRDECKGWDAAAWGDDDLALSAMRAYAARVRAEHPGPGWHFDPLHAMRCSHGHLPIDGCSAGCHATIRTGDK